MTWDHIEGDSLWIPEPKGASSRAYSVPLYTQALEVVAEAGACRRYGNNHVFWSETSKDGRITNFNQHGVPNPHWFRHHWRFRAQGLFKRNIGRRVEAELIMNHRTTIMDDVESNYANADQHEWMTTAQAVADEIDRVIYGK